MYRVGIIGAGWVAGEHLRAYINNPKTEVAAFAVRRPETAHALIESHGINAEVYTDVARMLHEADLDIISVCSPPSAHAENVIAAAEAGCHIVIEKPVALSLSDLRKMQSAVNAANVRTVVSLVLRWNPLFDVIKGLLAQNAIGKLFYAEVDYQHGVGPWYAQYKWNRTEADGGSSLLSAGIHALDALRWFVGKSPSR